jgi:hypothetical protein
MSNIFKLSGNFSKEIIFIPIFGEKKLLDRQINFFNFLNFDKSGIIIFLLNLNEKSFKLIFKISISSGNESINIKITY